LLERNNKLKVQAVIFIFSPTFKFAITLIELELKLQANSSDVLIKIRDKCFLLKSSAIAKID